MILIFEYCWIVCGIYSTVKGVGSTAVKFVLQSSRFLALILNLGFCLCEIIVYVLPVPTWGPSGFSGFPPPLKNMHVGGLAMLKL